MVAARKLEPQKQLIEVLLLHKFEGAYPDVPISSDIDYEGLVQPDIEASEKPFFITLLLGYHNQVSRNLRRYVNDTAPKAIRDAIQTRRITGQLGHTAEDHQAWEFKIPCLHWVGALIDDSGQVWGKAYVPRTAMELREYYRIQARTNATVGTSLSGMGYQEWNDELEMWDILELEVHRIDAVSPEGVGILKAGSMPPKITTETKQDIQEAAPDDIAVGDFVTWERDGSLVRGQVNTLWTEGEVEVPYSDDAPKLIATVENPIARMDVFEPNWEGEGWRRTSWQVVQYVSNLSKIESLPESHTEDNPLSEGQADNSELPDVLDSEDKPSMATKPNEILDVDIRIVELEEQHKEAVRKLMKEISEKNAALRNYETMRKMLGMDGETPTDPVLALQGLVTKSQTLEAENFDLLEAAIEQAVAKSVKVEILRPVIVENIKMMKPARKVDVAQALGVVLEKPEIKQMLKYTVQQEMGPNVTTPTSDGSGVNDPNNTDIMILIPGM